VSEKTPSQLLPEADCITALRECEVVETLKQSASSQGNARVFSFSSVENSYGKTRRKYCLYLQSYSNAAVENVKEEGFVLEPQAR
jgi:hypothetical protein